MNNSVKDFIQKIRSNDHVIAENDYNNVGDLEDMVYHLGKLDACEVIEHAFERMKQSDCDLVIFFDGFFDQMLDAKEAFVKMFPAEDNK